MTDCAFSPAPTCSIAREQLKATADPTSRAVLDGRQKALKLTSEGRVPAGLQRETRGRPSPAGNVGSAGLARYDGGPRPLAGPHSSKEVPVHPALHPARPPSHMKAFRSSLPHHAGNAVYGFTATKISPLQCPEAADSCLAMGRESTRHAASLPFLPCLDAAATPFAQHPLRSAPCWLLSCGAHTMTCILAANACFFSPSHCLCSRAKELVEHAGREGRLSPHGAGAQVLYGHTDSIFVQFPQAGPLRCWAPFLLIPLPANAQKVPRSA